jgi:hypothetical protein
MLTGLKIFAERKLCIAETLSSLNPVLAYHWEGVPVSDRERGIFNPLSPFRLVDHPGDADLCILPKEWNYYLWHNRKNEAVRMSDLAKQFGKKILIWFRGDLPPIIPMANAMVFKCAMNRSRASDDRFAAPYFIDDPAKRHAGDNPFWRKKNANPVVGFCGYARVKPLKLLYSIASHARHNLQVSLGRSNYESMPVIPATVLRARALSLLARDERITTDFVIRDRYRAGIRKDPLSQSAAATEFFDNIFRTDYTVCVRGHGNWSVRLYETLACGRIPIFIDTDCVLPFEFAIDWKKYAVWVPQCEILRIVDIVSSFHSKLSPSDFLDLQLSCRRLWEERLCLSGFMKHLSEHFSSGTFAESEKHDE